MRFVHYRSAASISSLAQNRCCARLFGFRPAASSARSQLPKRRRTHSEPGRSGLARIHSQEFGGRPCLTVHSFSAAMISSSDHAAGRRWRPPALSVARAHTRRSMRTSTGSGNHPSIGAGCSCAAISVWVAVLWIWIAVNHWRLPPSRSPRDRALSVAPTEGTIVRTSGPTVTFVDRAQGELGLAR